MISQKLFALSLTAESAGQLLDVDLEAAREQIDRLRQLSQEALEELRYLILELRPPELERDGLATTLRKHVEVLRRVQTGGPRSGSSSTACRPPRRRRDRELLRIAQEALQNAIKHACATRIVLRVGTADGRLVLEVTDDGGGFDPQASGVRSRRLGLCSMEERARRLDGQLSIASVGGRGDDRPARGAAWLTRSACSSSTTTRSSARGSAPSCGCRREST